MPFSKSSTNDIAELTRLSMSGAWVKHPIRLTRDSGGGDIRRALKSFGAGAPALKTGPQLDLIVEVAAGLRQRTLVRGGSGLVRHRLAQYPRGGDQIGLRRMLLFIDAHHHDVVMFGGAHVERVYRFPVADDGLFHRRFPFGL